MPLMEEKVGTDVQYYIHFGSFVHAEIWARVTSLNHERLQGDPSRRRKNTSLKIALSNTAVSELIG
jgi:hypothetical protein